MDQESSAAASSSSGSSASSSSDNDDSESSASAESINHHLASKSIKDTNLLLKKVASLEKAVGKWKAKYEKQVKENIKLKNELEKFTEKKHIVSAEKNTKKSPIWWNDYGMQSNQQKQIDENLRRKSSPYVLSPASRQEQKAAGLVDHRFQTRTKVSPHKKITSPLITTKKDVITPLISSPTRTVTSPVQIPSPLLTSPTPFSPKLKLGNQSFEHNQHHFFDHFFIAKYSDGHAYIDPNNNASKIIYEWSQSKQPLPHNVVQFCFPDAMQIKEHAINLSQSEMNRIIYGRPCKNENSFMFVLAANDQMVEVKPGDAAPSSLDNATYGVCVIVDELVIGPSSASYYASNRNGNKNGSPATSPSRVSPLNSFRKMMKQGKTDSEDEDDGNKGILARRKLMRITKYDDDDNIYINNHFNMVASTESKTNEAMLSPNRKGQPYSIDEILFKYYSSKVPAFGNSVYLKIENLLPNLEFTRIRHNSLLHERWELLKQWCFPVLVSQLPLDQLLFLVGCLLLELKIVVVEPKLATLSSAVLSLVPLLKPLCWIQPIIPILPEELHVICESPVPLLIGCQTLPEMLQDAIKKESSLSFKRNQSINGFDHGRQEAVVVLLEKGELHLSKELATSYHTIKLPGLDTLYHDLEPHYKHLMDSRSRSLVKRNNNFGVPLCCPTPKQTEAMEAITDRVEKHVEALVAMAHRFRHSTSDFATLEEQGTIKLQAEEELLLFAPVLGHGVSTCWPFIDRLRLTQMFIQWSESKYGPPTGFQSPNTWNNAATINNSTFTCSENENESKREAFDKTMTLTPSPSGGFVGHGYSLDTVHSAASESEEEELQARQSPIKSPRFSISSSGRGKKRSGTGSRTFSTSTDNTNSAFAYFDDDDDDEDDDSDGGESVMTLPHYQRRSVFLQRNASNRSIESGYENKIESKVGSDSRVRFTSHPQQTSNMSMNPKSPLNSKKPKTRVKAQRRRHSAFVHKQDLPPSRFSKIEERRSTLTNTTLGRGRRGVQHDEQVDVDHQEEISPIEIRERNLKSSLTDNISPVSPFAYTFDKDL